MHAKVLRSLGCTSEALRIYEQLHAWDDVVDCYRALGQLEKAETLVRSLLNTGTDGKNANYLCILGDITNNTKCYTTAIEVSIENIRSFHS